MINRRVTRTVLGGTEQTLKTGSINSDTLAFSLADTDEFFIGFHAPFASRFFKMGSVVNAEASTISLDYWDGSAWTPVDDLVDQTAVGGAAFAQSGFISWVNPGDWKKRSLTGVDADVELFWVRLKVSAQLTALVTLQAVLNLFSDDNGLRALYPELVSDSRYLPANRTDFIEQHQAAKDQIVLRLKQRKLITDESQVIDVNAVWAAAVHACAWIILSPIANNDVKREMAEEARKNMEKEVAQTYLGIDQNSDGVVSEAERKSLSETAVFRR